MENSEFKKARVALKFTQSEIADKLKLTQAGLSFKEDGRSPFTPLEQEKLIKLYAEYFNDMPRIISENIYQALKGKKISFDADGRHAIKDTLDKLISEYE